MSVDDLVKRLKLYIKIGVVLALIEAIYVGLSAWVWDTWVSPDPFLTLGLIGVMFILGYVTGISLTLEVLRGVEK
jgi:hypothetical protein